MRIRCGLAGFVLSCGCAAGVYETYDIGIVSVIDERSARCTNRAHQQGRPFALGLSDGQQAPDLVGTVLERPRPSTSRDIQS
ncbi:MAG: hypothetical protein AB7I50_13605 [Vicinamibacterales bacterium]